jgi:hypothetical protein
MLNPSRPHCCSPQEYQSPIEAAPRKRAVHRFLVPFFGSFLGNQKRTKNILSKSFNQCLFFNQAIAQHANSKTVDFKNTRSLTLFHKHPTHYQFLTACGVFIKTFACFYAQMPCSDHIHQQGTRGKFGVPKTVLQDF